MLYIDEFSVACWVFCRCLYKYANVALTFIHIYSQKINDKKMICQEEASFKTNVLRGLTSDSTSCKRLRTRQCY